MTDRQVKIITHEYILLEMNQHVNHHRNNEYYDCYS